MFESGEDAAEHLFRDDLPLILPNHLLHSQCRVVLEILIQRSLVRLHDVPGRTLHTDRLDIEGSADRRQDNVQSLLLVFSCNRSLQEISEVGDVCARRAILFELESDLSEVE